MIKLDTEFGTFETVQTGDFVDVYLKLNTETIHLGWIKLEWADVDSRTTATQCMSRFSEIFLTILRHEAKSGFFVGIPLGNPFRDAVLRMQIENTGQTLAVRNFIQNYIQDHDWITYPKHGEYYSIDNYRNEYKFVLSTPYGSYRLTNIDQYSFHLIRVREGTESTLSLIRIPYQQDSLNIFLAACQQATEVIMVDTQDTILRKLKEISKRTAEAIKYMFNYDKLRQSLRKKSIQ